MTGKAKHVSNRCRKGDCLNCKLTGCNHKCHKEKEPEEL